MHNRNVGNWPPGQEKKGTAPKHICQRITEAEAELAEAQTEYDIWKEQMEKLRTKAWYDYHEENGWPEGDLNYKRRVCAKVGVVIDE